MENSPSSSPNAEVQQPEGPMSLTGAEVEPVPVDSNVEVDRERLQQGIEAGEIDPSTLPAGLQDVLADDTDLRVGMGFNSAADSSQVDT
ncbi:MAG TPA: hypothetical protein VK694_00105 [Verrucomicrobiae bacterium]|nr:hypothetical protein [Verrucomicrobiae bacterium]